MSELQLIAAAAYLTLLFLGGTAAVANIAALAHLKANEPQNEEE